MEKRVSYSYLSESLIEEPSEDEDDSDSNYYDDSDEEISTLVPGNASNIE